MPGAGDEISVQLEWDFSGRWLIVPLSVGQDVVLQMLPNPLLSRSLISEEARDDLIRRSVLPPSVLRRCRLTDLRIKSQMVRDLSVFVVPPAQTFGVDGLLGRDFFAQFIDVRWDVRGNRLTLVDP